MLFEKKGQENTEKTIEIAVNKALELNIDYIVTASKTGRTAKLLREKAPKKINVVCVTYHFGFKENGKNFMEDEMKKQLEKADVPILTTTHLMAGLDRALRFKFNGIYPAEIIAFTLRMFGHGVKVCVEIASMALDAGLVPFGKEIITLGGHSGGVDTAVILTPAHSNNFFDTKIKEILCRPRNF
jgi:hypothetical protein